MAFGVESPCTSQKFLELLVCKTQSELVERNDKWNKDPYYTHPNNFLIGRPIWYPVYTLNTINAKVVKSILRVHKGPQTKRHTVHVMMPGPSETTSKTFVDVRGSK